MPPKIHLDLPARIGTDFVDAFDVHLVDQTTASWEFWFGLLQRFAEREGHIRVPARFQEDGYPLGSWVSTQRGRYGNGQLTADRVARLEALPGWVWSTQAADWEENFGRLCRFVEREGHARVPRKYEDNASLLGIWVTSQRVLYGRGQLTADRVARLEAVPGWAWDAVAAAWEQGFERLCRFVEREGDVRVLARFQEDGYPLGSWVNTQRMFYRRGKLAADKVTRLEALPGWVWSTQAADWEEGCERLCRFVEREGHA